MEISITKIHTSLFTYCESYIRRKIFFDAAESLDLQVIQGSFT